MVTVSRFRGIEVVFRFNEHEPPHYHVRYGEYWLEVAIAPFHVISGTAPRRVVALLREWAIQHAVELSAAWDACRKGETPLPISGLD